MLDSHLKDNGAAVMLNPQDIVATTTASKVMDVAGFSSASVAVMFGGLTGQAATKTVTPVLQESDTTVGADFTDVAADDIDGAFVTVENVDKAGTVQRVGYKGYKKYIRVNLVVVGAPTETKVAVLGMTGVKRQGKWPAADPTVSNAS